VRRRGTFRPVRVVWRVMPTIPKVAFTATEALRREIRGSLPNSVLSGSTPAHVDCDLTPLQSNHLANCIISLPYHAADVRLCTDVSYRTRYQLEHAVCLISLRSIGHHHRDGGRHCLGGVTTLRSKRAVPMRPFSSQAQTRIRLWMRPNSRYPPQIP
jgi:hypothetical protein